MAASVIPPRYCPDRPLPPYSYVPGLSPHPTSDPRGHSYMPAGPPQPVIFLVDRLGENAMFRFAIDLYNHGYYWEAHEAWESLWHAAGRRGEAADFLKGLIKLAAAGVKLREGRPLGVMRHARRAGELFRSVAASGSAEKAADFGLPLDELIAAANSLAELAPSQQSDQSPDASPDASRRLPVLLRLIEPPDAA
jgi:hypothetical protein